MCEDKKKIYCGRCDSDFYVEETDEKDVTYCPFCKNTELDK